MFFAQYGSESRGGGEAGEVPRSESERRSEKGRKWNKKTPYWRSLSCEP
jgi:hypothetical protein